ncbi:hypothetical protein [uncultured Parabacteroides sp.]|uniref:hypothetical protein n=1 Tax=uncultured Parabacteroides sp. TaxID=512312 RepID=UPI002587514A|nr:hypothetical protein [uncultured Parabacteroides sp.]
MKKLLMALLGAQPAVCVYQQHVNNLLPEDKEGFYKDSFALAFSDWRNLSPAYRDFFVSLIKSERQRFIDFVRNDTVLGEFLYDVKDEALFIRILSLLERPDKKRKTSYTKLAFAVKLGFNVDLKVKYLSDKIRYARADTDDLYELFEKIAIE